MQVEYDDENMCMMRGCTQVDLLPSKCGKCKRRFCTEHIAYSDHKCMSHRDASVLRCPLCQKEVPCDAKASPDVVISQHIDRGCKDLPGPPTVVERMNFCSMESCTRNELVLVVCDKCGNSYCVDHRMPSRHNCRCLTTSPAQRQVSNPPVTSSRLFSPTNVRNSLSNPLGSYKGDEGLTVCVYFEVEARVQPFYFRCSQRVVVGKMLDQLCLAADVPNSNNSASDNLWKIFAIRSKPAAPLSSTSPVGALLSMSATVSTVVGEGDAIFVTKSLELPTYVGEAATRGPSAQGSVSRTCAQM